MTIHNSDPNEQLQASVFSCPSSGGIAEPLISVLMPVYNAGHYLSESVESILGQSLNAFEFIITDDGSTDNSLEILREYALQDSRIRLISRQNTGYTMALNEMLALARASFVARMDADDIALPDRLKCQISFLDAHHDHVVVGTQVEVVDPDGWPIYIWRQATGHEDILAGLLRYKRSNGIIIHPSAMMRRETLALIGGYRTEFEPSEDTDLFLRLAEHGRLANLPTTLLRYRVHYTNVSQLQRQKQSKSMRNAVIEAYQRMGTPMPQDHAFFSQTDLPEVSSDRPNPDPVPCPVKANNWELHVRWSWQAIGSDNFATARKHSWAALKTKPFSLTSWRIAIHSFTNRKLSQLLKFPFAILASQSTQRSEA